jgi:DNA-binding PadR family transcriptional regulator
MDVTLLGYVLLGLLRQAPATGYDLRKLFATSPLMTFSDSPGAIYPALRKLERQGLIRGQVEQGSGLRLRRVFQLTPAGLRELRRWLTLPVTRDEVVRKQDRLLARFAFMDDAAGRADSVRLLQEIEREAAAYLPELRDYLERNEPGMPLSGRLALDGGVRSHEALLEWSRAALAAYGQAGKDDTP